MKSLRDKKIIIETMLCWKNEGMIGSMLTTNYLLNISRQDAMKVFAKSEHTCQKLEGREPIFAAIYLLKQVLQRIPERIKEE